MATTASPPPSAPVGVAALTPEQLAASDELDREIASIREEIAALSKRQSLLTSTLLASSAVQSQLRQRYSSNEDLTALLNKHSILARTSAHRLAFGVTCFPFVDPSPDTSNARLLGVRFDICKRNGQFDAPYYVLLRRTKTVGVNNADEPSVANEWSVHRHTIPALVPLQEHADRYLPVTDEGYGSEGSMGQGGERPVDLLGFVTAVRNELASWHLRKEAIESCNEQLLEPSPDGESEGQGSQQRKFGVECVEAVAVDAHYARIVWQDGKVGRIKIGRDGRIEKAVVLRTVNNENIRCQSVERTLLAGSGRIQDFAARLRDVAANSTDK
ncbi:hypothetical protein DV737_g2581, partial [Chaetothyriales sp. CBS 132003]